MKIGQLMWSVVVLPKLEVAEKMMLVPKKIVVAPALTQTQLKLGYTVAL